MTNYFTALLKSTNIHQYQPPALGAEQPVPEHRRVSSPSHAPPGAVAGRAVGSGQLVPAGHRGRSQSGRLGWEEPEAPWCWAGWLGPACMGFLGGAH